jgi:hypothetical protein
VIEYYGFDNLGNTESIQTITVYLDNMPPETSVTVGDPQHLAPDDRLFITSHTPIELHAVDNPGGSGVAFITYRINDGAWTTINGTDWTFTIPGEDAEYVVSYYSTDNCGNAESVQSITLYLDNTPPVVTLCVELIGTDHRVYLPDDVTNIELTDNEKLVAEVADATEKEIGGSILPILCSGLKSARFRIAGGPWQDLTLDNLDAALIGEDEVLTEIEAVDNVENTTLKSYIISHYAIFSVPGAMISVTEDISFLNSGITVDSYNSETGMQHTHNGDVISKGEFIVNGEPDVRGDIYEYTDTMIERVPVPADAQVIDEIIVDSGQTRIINHGTYYIKKLIVNSNARLVIQGGWVKIWFDTCTIDGTVEVDIVKHLWMLGTDATPHLNINGSTNFKGIMFTHNAYINVNGYVDGSVIGKGVTANSGAYIYYDEDTKIHDRWIGIDPQPDPDPPQTGQILRQWWTWIGGTTVNDLTSNVNYPDNPTGSEYITSFEGPTYWGNMYGSRIVGYLHPQTTGSYTFWIASDDQSELWLNTDENPWNRVFIAGVNGWTNPREFDKDGSQRSSSIWLEADKIYYIEAIHKEGFQGDHLSVAWETPVSGRQVIGGEYLSPLE